MKHPTLLFACSGVDSAPWLAGLAEEFPGIEVRLWPNIGDPAEIDYAFVWKPEKEVFKGLVNLKLISLDVFHQEPLPASHAYWRHPKVIVVPHSSALTQPKTAVRTLAANLRRAIGDEPVENIVDLARGY